MSTTSRAQTLLAVAGLAACGVVGTLALALVRQNNVDVYFDNGLDRPVTLSVDGFPQKLAPGQVRKQQLRPGRHEVLVESDDGEIERGPVEIEKKSPMTALMSPEFYVYNVAEAHIYRRATHVYAAEESLRSYSERLYPFERFFSQPKAHFVFQAAPDEIQTDRSTATRQVFDVASDLDYNRIAMMRYAEGNLSEAEKAVDKALELEPCHPAAYRNRIAILSADGPTPEALAAAEAWFDTCEQAGVEAHRAYQDTRMDLEGKSPVLSLYRERRRREPTAENHYLLARLLQGEGALSEYDAALSKDPSFQRARLARAYERMGLERYEEALTDIETVLESAELDDEAAYLYGFALVGAERPGDGDEKLQALTRKYPYDLTFWSARWVTTLAREDWASAERLLLEYQQLTGVEDWAYRQQLLRLEGSLDEAAERLDAAAQRPDLAPQVPVPRFRLLFAEGRYPEAAALSEEEESGSELQRLYAAAGLGMAKRAEESRAILGALAADLETSGQGPEVEFYRAMLRALAGRGSSKEAIEAAREASFLMLPHAYFLLGARALGAENRAEASRYFELSQRTGVARDFPYSVAGSLRN